MSPIADISLQDTLFSPLYALIDSCSNTRQCPDFSDKDFLLTSLLRVLDPQESGRDFLQSLSDIHQYELQRSQFFDTLKSKRRLRFLEEICIRLKDACQEQLALHDPFAQMPELAGREIYAGDGHYIEHAVHDARQALYKNTPYVAIGHFFSLNLRTHWMEYLDLAGKGTKKQHDMSVLKRVSEKLKVGGKKGIIWLWDKGGIDIGFWVSQKHLHGVYFIGRLKENMKPQKSGNLPWDQNDERNEGVEADELVGISGHIIRLVTYIDPETGTVYKYITTDMMLPPGLIAHLYRLRWNLEKVFDETENKLHENKGWATSETAKRMQGQFTALGHNMLLLLEAKVEREHGIRDEKVARKYERTLRKRAQEARKNGKRLPRMIKRLRTRATQFSFQYIRWLRNHLTKQASYSESLPALRAAMETYL